MSSETIIALGSALVGGSAFGTIILAFFNRKKVDAEARNITVSGELKISQTALQMLDELRVELTDLRKRHNNLQKDFDVLKSDHDATVKRNKVLEANQKNCPNCNPNN